MNLPTESSMPRPPVALVRAGKEIDRWIESGVSELEWAKTVVEGYRKRARNTETQDAYDWLIMRLARAINDLESVADEWRRA